MRPATSRPTWSLALLAMSVAACSTVQPSEPVPLVIAPFKEPPVLARPAAPAKVVEVNLDASATRLSPIGGQPVTLYTYNGTYPGPTLDLREGDHVVVHFKNGLPEPTNVHWHGLHVPSSQDGSPMDLVAPGARRDYEFDIPTGTAGTYWYHPHPHGATAMQVARGLFGAIRVRAADDPLRASFGDTLLVLSDNRFEADGSVAADTEADKMNGREGDQFFVNGQLSPTLTLRPGEIRRLRVLNASAGHYYRLAIPGVSMVQVGTDGGLFGAPVAVKELLLAPAERAELLVKVAGAPTQLEDRPYDRGAMDPAAHGMGHTMSLQNLTMATRNLLTIAVSSEPQVADVSFPTTLREVPALEPATAVDHTITFTEDHMALDFRVNDKIFDPARVDVRSKLGTTERWAVVNKGDMDHPFHLHGFPFQVLARNGVPEPVRAWKDTVNLKRGEAVDLAVKFADFAGPRVFHCHIIEHEDQGMMGLLQVE